VHIYPQQLRNIQSEYLRVHISLCAMYRATFEGPYTVRPQLFQLLSFQQPSCFMLERTLDSRTNVKPDLEGNPNYFHFGIIAVVRYRFMTCREWCVLVEGDDAFANRARHMQSRSRPSATAQTVFRTQSRGTGLSPVSVTGFFEQVPGTPATCRSVPHYAPSIAVQKTQGPMQLICISTLHRRTWPA
jgi:hypothetical protein